MASVNNPKQTNNPDPTSATYGTFYSPAGYPVDQNTYDALVALFIQQGSAPTAAGALASTVFRISANTGIPATTLLTELQGTNNLDINSYLSYYLNLVNSPTTLQGVTTPIQPDFYAARTVLD
jgi:hypothetical protein